MNLHGIVAGNISAVNPFVTVVISASAGYATLPSAERVPQYNNTPAQAQIQAMTGGDLRQIEGLNLNGTLRKFYFYGDVEATVRADLKGGDIITDMEGQEWLVNQVMETWPDWCAVVATLQVPTP
jgi:hypothetical protein